MNVDRDELKTEDHFKTHINKTETYIIAVANQAINSKDISNYQVYTFPHNSGGLVVSFKFKQKFKLVLSQMQLSNALISIGAAISVAYSCWTVSKFLLNIKYRNWLGRRILIYQDHRKTQQLLMQGRAPY